MVWRTIFTGSRAFRRCRFIYYSRTAAAHRNTTLSDRSVEWYDGGLNSFFVKMITFTMLALMGISMPVFCSSGCHIHAVAAMFSLSCSAIWLACSMSVWRDRFLTIHDRASMKMNGDLDTHAREQRFFVTRVIKLDMDRNTLADFGIVATAVIRGRQQRELTGGGSNDLGDMTGDRGVVGIDMDIYCLPHGYVFDGAFINIGGDLHTRGVGFLRYRGARAYELPNGARDLHDDPIHRGNQVLDRREAIQGLDGANTLFGAHQRPYLDIQGNEGARGRWYDVDHRAGHLGIVSWVEVVGIVEQITDHSPDQDEGQDEGR